MAPTGIVMEGLGKDYGERTSSRGSPSRCRPEMFRPSRPERGGQDDDGAHPRDARGPGRGRATVSGFDVVTQPELVRAHIGVTGQATAIDELLSGRETLEMEGRLQHLGASDARRRADELLERFDLSDAGGRRVGNVSGGMQRRLDLAASLVVTPDVLFLDEPTTGLDLEAAWRCGTRFATWPPTARPSCSPPSTSRRPTASPIALR